MSTPEEVMSERLVRVETKLDLLIADLAPHRRSIAEQHDAHDVRLRALETAVTEIKTRVALVAGGTGTVGGIVTAVIAHFIGA